MAVVPASATFRVRKNAASLKRLPIRESHHGQLAFRVRKNAASLKLARRHRQRIAGCYFPRSQERGLIEACDLAECLFRDRYFPRSQERGLIEARRVFPIRRIVARILSAFARTRPH